MSVLSALRISHRPAAAFCIVGLFWGSMAALAPQLKAQINADDAQFGMLLLGTSLGLLTTMILAPIFDRIMGQWGLPVAAIGLACAFLLPGLATTHMAFFLAMCAAGLGSGLLDVTMNARVSELEAQHNRSLMNANHGMFSVAYALGAFCTGLGREAGFAPFTIFATVGVVALLLVTRTRMQVVEISEEERAAATFPWGIVGLCGAVVLIAFMAEAAVESWSALHVERTLGGRAAQGALGPTMLGLTMAVGRFGGQAVAEKWSDLAVITGGAILSIAGALIAALAPTPLIAYIGFGTLGLGVSAIGPIGLAMVGRMVSPAVRTKAISRAAVIGFSGFFVAPAAMGIISHSYGLRMAFAALALLVVALFPLLVVLKRRGA
ncbi:MAG: MFS transporter [Litoreibacter sp.]|nr:MFS transporter [Litoreibacter sp.]